MDLKDISAMLEGEEVDVLSRSIYEKKIIVRTGTLSEITEQFVFLDNFGINFVMSDQAIVAIQAQEIPIYKNPLVSEAYAYGNKELGQDEKEKIRSGGQFLKNQLTYLRDGRN